MIKISTLDVIILVVLLIGASSGYKKGIIGSLVGLFGNIVALLLAVKSYRPVAHLLDSQWSLASKIHVFLLSRCPEPLEASNLVPINDSGMQILFTKIEQMVLPEWVKSKIILESFNLAKLTDHLGLINIGEILTFIVARIILNGLVFLLLWFLLTKFIYLFAQFISKNLDGIFIIGSINRLGGFLSGFALSALAIMVLAGLNNLFWEITKLVEPETVSNSSLLPYFKTSYDLLLSKILTFI